MQQAYRGEYLVVTCVERVLFLANIFYQHKIISSLFFQVYAWKKRDERSEQKRMIDYKAVDGKLRRDVLDAKAMRRMFEGSGHYALLAKIKIKGKW